MAAAERVSRCCSNSPVEYYWNGLPALVGDAAVAWLADEVLRVLKLDGSRRWTPYNEPLIRSEVAAYIASGQMGVLVPVKHVKAISRAPKEYIFEIRMEFQVSAVDAAGRSRFTKAEVRQYHSEPAAIADIFVGLHVHEKAIVRGDKVETKRLQNVEIDIAVQAFMRGEPYNWGVC